MHGRHQIIERVAVLSIRHNGATSGSACLHVPQQRQVFLSQLAGPVQFSCACDDQCMASGLWVLVMNQQALLVQLHLWVIRCKPARTRQALLQTLSMNKWSSGQEEMVVRPGNER